MRDNTHWVGTWTAAPAPAEGAAFGNHTLRMIPRVSIGGSALRVRISNAYGTRPLAIGAACVGLRSAGPAVVPGSSRRITFGGEAGATIAVGALVVSDPVELAFAPLSDLAVSVHLPDDLPASFGITGRYARQTNCISPPSSSSRRRWRYLSNWAFDRELFSPYSPPKRRITISSFPPASGRTRRKRPRATCRRS